MALPLPSVVSNVGPGGPLVTNMQGMNALQKSNLENQYYGPNMQSQIGYRNALTQGQNIENQYMPEKLRLANAFAQLQNQYYGPNIQSEIGLRGAEASNYGAEAAKTNYMLQHPGLLGGEEAKTIQSLMDMGYIPKTSPNSTAAQTAPTPSNAVTQPAVNTQTTPTQNNLLNMNDASQPFNTGNAMVDALLNKQFAAANYQRKMAQGFDWVHSPVDAKSYQIAQLAGAGIDPSEGIQLLSSGHTVPEVLEAKGFPKGYTPDPDFLPTRGNITQLKTRQAALKEVDSLGEFVRDGLGPYARTFGGMSPAQVGDALSGQDENKQAKFLAARMLAPELGTVRIILAQGRPGITALKQLMDKSLTNVGAYQSLVSPKVFDKAQKMADKALTDAFSKATEVYKVGKKSSSSDKDMVTVAIPGGKTIELPREGANRLIKDYPDHKIIG